MATFTLICCRASHHKFYQVTRTNYSSYICSWGRIGKPPQGTREYHGNDGASKVDEKLRKGYCPVEELDPGDDCPCGAGPMRWWNTRFQVCPVCGNKFSAAGGLDDLVRMIEAKQEGRRAV